LLKKLQFLLVVLAAAGCVTKPAAVDAPLSVVGRPDVMEVGPVLHAVNELGQTASFRSGGIDNLFKDAGSPAGSAGAFDHAAGRADVAAQAETQALRASVDHPNLRIILTVTEGLYRVVARRSAGITGMSDLRGKRIGVFEGTSAAYFLHCMLAGAGLSEEDVVLVPLRPREMEPAIAARQVDAVVIWEPESERSLATLGADAIAFSDPLQYRELYNLNTTAEALADPSRRGKIVALVRAVLASGKVAQDRPQEIWPLVSASSGYDLRLVARSWPHHSFPGDLPADVVDVLYAEEQWLAQEHDRRPRSREIIASMIDRSVLEEARR